MPNHNFNFTRLFTIIAIASVIIFLFTLAISPVQAVTGINRQINFQGKLVNNPTSTNVNDTTYTVIFSFYDTSSGGTSLWSETQSVTTKDGIFRVALGSVTPFPANFNFNWSGLYLGIKVNSDSEMTPRVAMAAVPFAFNSEKVAGLTVQDTSGNASTSGILQIANGKTFNFGNNNLTFTTSGDTALTLPTSGTVCTTITCLTSAINWWNQVGGLVYPTDSNYDFAVGGSATTSALFSFTGIQSSGHQTIASISGNLVVAPNNGYGGVIQPSTDNVQDIGSAAKSWANLYLDTALRMSGNVAIDASRNFQGATLSLSTANANVVSVTSTGNSSTIAKFNYANANFTVFAISGLGTAPVASLGSKTSFASLVSNNDGVGDLFTASQSGWTRFVIQNNGSLRLVGNNTSDIDTLTANTLTIGGSSANALVLGSSTLASMTFNVGSGNNFVFKKNGSAFSCSGTDKLTLDGSGNLVCSTDQNTGSGVNWWNQVGGLVYPTDINYDFAVGGSATTSALFSFTGIQSAGHQTIASISGNLIVMPNNGYGGNVGIGTNLPSAALDVRSTAKGINIGGSPSTFINFGAAFGTGSTGIDFTNGGNFNNIGTSNTNTGIKFTTITGAAKGIDFSQNINGPGTSNIFTGQYINITPSFNWSAGSGIFSETGNYLKIARSESVGTAGLSLNLSGDLEALSSNCTVTSGVCADTSHILSLNQYLASASGNVLQINNGGNGIALVASSSASNVAIASISGSTSFAALVVDNSGVGDLFTASASGLSKFVITRNGNVGINKSLPTAKLDIVGIAADTGINLSGISSGTGILLNTAISSGTGINLTGSAITNGTGLIIGGTIGGNSGVNFSGSYFKINPIKNLTQISGGGVLDSGNFVNVARANTVSVINTYSISGDLVAFSSNCTASNGGVCADTSHILSLTQSLASASGSVLFISNSGQGVGEQITSNSGGQSGLIINKTGDTGDIFTASSSGTPKFVIDLNGNLKVAASSGFDVLSAGTLNIGTTTANALVLGNSSLASMTFNVGSGNNFVFKKNGSAFSCSGTDKLTLDGSGNLVCSSDQTGGGGGVNWWNQVGGLVYPTSSLYDFAVGGSATTSALFSFTGIQSAGHQTQASISGNLIVMPNNGFGGNVAIGTATIDPATQLYVESASGRVVVSSTTNSNNAGYRLKAKDSGGASGTAGYYFIKGTTDATTYLGLSPDDLNYSLIVNKSGFTGIGTTTPVGELEVLSSSNTNVNRGITSTQVNSGAQAAQINFQKARGAVGSLATVVNGDYTGSFGFFNHDGTNYLETAAFGARVNGTVGAGSIPTDLFFATSGGPADSDPYGNNHIRLLISSLGNIGINTTSPLTTLDVRGNSGTVGVASVSGKTSFATLVVDNSIGDLFTASSSGLNRFVITQTGNVGIGTTNPGEKIEIGGGAAGIYLNGTTTNLIRFNTLQVAAPSLTTRSIGTKLVLYPQISGSEVDYAMGVEPSALWYSVPGANSTYSYKFYGGTTELMRIRGDGNVGIGATNPTSFLHVLKTLTSAVQDGVVFDITSSNTATSPNRSARIDLEAGYTGSGASQALGVNNYVAGTGSNLGGVASAVGNYGAVNGARGTTTGANVGTYGWAGNGLRNVGVVGDATFQQTNNASALSLGIYGIALRNTAGIEIGGYFGLQSSEPTFVSAALIADNGAESAPIFIARSNGTEELRIDSLGNLGIGTSSPLSTLDVRGNSGTLTVASISGKTSFASLVANNNGVGDLFTASASGWSRFTITNAGGIALGPNGTNVGTSSQCLLGGTIASWGSCGIGGSGVNWWNQVGGLVYPTSSLYDFAVGGSATASALFSFTGIQSAGNQTIASISGNFVVMPNNGYGGSASISAGLVLGSQSTAAIQSTKNQQLTIGGDTTGNIIISPSNGSSVGTLTVNASNTFFGRNSAMNGLISFYSSAGVTPATIGTDASGNLNLAANQAGASVVVGSGVGDIVIDPGSYKVGIGISSSILSQLQVTRALSNGATGKALAIFDQIENQDVFTASKSGIPLFIIGKNGEIGLGLSGGVQNFGGSNQCLLSGGTGSSASWGSCDPTGGWWNQVGGLVYPTSSLYDFAVGGSSTASALFTYTGIQSATHQTLASISGNLNLMPNNGFGGNLTLSGVGGITLSGNTAGITFTGTGTTQINTASNQNISINAGGNGLIGLNTDGGSVLASFDVRSQNGTISIASISGNTSFAGLTVDNAGGDIFTASASGATRFRIAQDGSIVSQGKTLTATGSLLNNSNPAAKNNTGAVTNAVGDQGSLIPNASFESIITANKTTNIAQTAIVDGWTVEATMSAMVTVISTDSAHGSNSLFFKMNASEVTSVFSTCIPLDNTVASQYNLNWYAKASANVRAVTRAYIWKYSSQTNCQSDTSGTITAPLNAAAVTNAWTAMTSGTAPTATANSNWAKVQIFMGCLASCPSATTAQIDGVRLIQTSNAVGLDYAENYQGDANNLAQSSDVVMLQSVNGKTVVVPANKPYDQKVIGVVTTKPGMVLDDPDQFEDPRVAVALAGQVPVKVSSKNGAIVVGDLLTSSDIAGVAMKATSSGQTIGKAMEIWDDPNPDNFGTIKMFINNSISNNQFSFDIANTDDSNAVLAALVAQAGRRGGQALKTDKLIAGVEIITPKLTAQEISVDKLNSLNKNIGLTFSDGKLKINNTGSLGITFDAFGNATFSGLITADKIRANSIEGLEILTDKLSSLSKSVSVLSSATTSALLSTDSAGLTSVPSDFSVGGNGIINKTLSVLQSISTPNLLVSDFASFFGDVFFKKSVRFDQAPTFNSDTAGFAVIKTGETSVEVTFDNEYLNDPVVTANISLDKEANTTAQSQLEDSILNGDIRYIVTRKTTKGFVIKLSKPAEQDIKFSWIAISVKDVKTSGLYPTPTIDPTATQSAGYQSIYNQLNNITPTPTQ